MQDYTEADFASVTFTMREDGFCHSSFTNVWYSNEGQAQYWTRKKMGLLIHEHRGEDKKPRTVKAKESFEVRYKRKMGRSILDDMAEQQEEIQQMKEMALAINDPADRFAAIERVNNMRDKFNRQWAPYLLSKQGTMLTDEKVEDQITIDDLYGEADEDNGS